MDNEYDVYYHKLAGAMSDELLSDDAPEPETAVGEAVKAAPEELPASIQLDGYNTIFDIKVTLTPVELVPLGTHTAQP